MRGFGSTAWGFGFELRAQGEVANFALLGHLSAERGREDRGCYGKVVSVLTAPLSNVGCVWSVTLLKASIMERFRV